MLVLPTFMNRTDRQEIDYSDLLARVQQDEVREITWDNNDGSITGELKNKTEFASNGPLEPSEDDRAMFREHDVKVKFDTPGGSWFTALLPLLIPVALFVGIFWLMQRRAASQMGGIMSIGRSRAKTYSTERPGTTFADVAGYEGVKQEITEVVDFLKHPERFAEIGARIPKGVLLVGPPGTGKTLIARAVAGEAGVPFLSVTGSDFMEMFVGVGASRVRDLFQNARKLGRAIIFVDEIDSIGRKRGAGLGGGHDEREQTLNQMLSEMDGFEATEGIVMMAATNRPDILDPALLRPGRFDRQVVVPLPEIDERRAILEVHCKSKRLAADIDLDVVARGTPGMSGADLSNLVNEAALFAVRDGSDEIRNSDFEQARDRVLMGTAARLDGAVRGREGGHRLPRGGPRRVRRGAAERRPGAQGHDPAHRHGAGRDPAVAGRREAHLPAGLHRGKPRSCAWAAASPRSWCSGSSPPAPTTTCVGSTELARKMVSEWGMSTRVGPMAWGSAGQVFLGEDLIHTRDYSDETARVIDEETERILRVQEERCRETLRQHRKGLDLVARALLEHETIDGAEVTRLIRVAANGGEAPPAPTTPGREGGGMEIGPDRGPDAPARSPGESGYGRGDGRRPAAALSSAARAPHLSGSSVRRSHDPTGLPLCQSAKTARLCSMKNVWS